MLKRETAQIRLISGSNERRNRKLSGVLAPSRTDVFVVSGSNEEKKRYAQKVLENVDCRIVLCSVQ